MASPQGYVRPKTLSTTGSEFTSAKRGKILDPSVRSGSAAPVTLGPQEGQSSASQLATEASRTVLAPSSVAVAANTPVAGTNRITWVDTNANETGYIVEVSADSGATFTTAATVGAGVVTADHVAGAGVTRQYRVRATHANGNSEPAGIVSATT